MNNRHFRISQRDLSELWPQEERFDLIAKIVSSYLPRVVLPGNDSFESGYDHAAVMRASYANGVRYPPPPEDPVQRRTAKCGLRKKTTIKIALCEPDFIQEKIVNKKFLPKYSFKKGILEVPSDFICYYSQTDDKIHEWNFGKPFGTTLWLTRQKQKMYLVVHQTRHGFVDALDSNEYVSDAWIYRIPTGAYYDALEQWDRRKLIDIDSEVRALGKNSRCVVTFDHLAR